MKKLRQKLSVQMALAIAGLLIASLIVFRVAVYEPPAKPAPVAATPVAPPAPPATPEKPAPPPQAIVLSVEGRVEHGKLGAGWTPLAPGQVLGSDERLRTFERGRTQLSIDDRSRVVVDETTEIAIAELSEKVHRFRLTRGRIAAEYGKRGERVLRVEDEQGSIHAEAQEARFSVLSTGTTIAVASSAGEVDLTSQQKTVRVHSGEGSIAARGLAPTKPAPIPTSLLVKVANVAAGISPTLCADVDGKVAPGSEVVVDGVAAKLARDGAFRVRVTRKPGKRNIRVAIRDVSGRTRTRVVPCIPAPGDIDDLAIRWRGN